MHQTEFCCYNTIKKVIFGINGYVGIATVIRVGTSNKIVACVDHFSQINTAVADVAGHGLSER